MASPPADLIDAWCPEALPVAHGLHPVSPLLAVCSVDGELSVVDIARRARVAAATVSISEARGGTLVLGGGAARPLVAWVGAQGLPWLWAFTEAESAGPASSPVCLDGVADFLPTLSQGRAHCRRLWLSAHGRPWLVCGAETGGGLISNGRVATHLEGAERIIGAGASPDGRRLAILREDGTLAIIEDPTREASLTDALGPSLLVEGVTACPIATLRPERLRLPLGVARRALRGHDGAFPGVAEIHWVDDELLTVAYVGPGERERHGYGALRPRRQLLCVSVESEGSLCVLEQIPLPSSVDLGVQVLRSEHPLCTVVEGGAPQWCWLAPQPHGAMVGSVGRRRPVCFVEPEALMAHAGSLRGHVAHLEGLRALGLRWDGREILLDRLRPDAQRLGPHRVEHDAVVGGLRTGLVEPIWVRSDEVQVLAADPEQADRVLHYRPPEVASPRVLVHPSLSRVPDEVRWRRSGRPPVRLLSVDVDEDGEYLAMWRAPGGVELWSLRVSDRLKAWTLWTARVSLGVRVMLDVAEPGYLPAMFILEAIGLVVDEEGEQGGGHMRISVRALEFGDASPHWLGVMTVPVASGVDVEGSEAVSRWLGGLRPTSSSGQEWSRSGDEATFKVVTDQGGRGGQGERR